MRSLNLATVITTVLRKAVRWRGESARRFSLVLAAALAIVGGTLVAAAPAYACDLNNHCYGIAGYSNSSIKGAHATIAPINSPNVGTSGNFVTDEVWLVATSSSYWVEIGYIDSYANIDGVSQGLSEFWFDSRPGGGAHGHVLVSNPQVVAKTFYITASTGNSYIAGDGTYYGTSTSNTMTPATAEIGSETTTSDSCSWSHDYSMAYSTGTGWMNLPSAWISVNSPQQLQWISAPTNMNAGVVCS